MNDTLTGDPLITVPIFSDPMQPGDRVSSLCYEVHGESDSLFNLITDKCTSVNGYYEKAVTSSESMGLNIVSQIGIRAVGESQNSCTDIEVDLEFCVTKVNGINISTTFTFDGITVKRYTNSYRVRVSVPNCADTMLVMWLFCKSRTMPDPAGNTSYSVNFIQFVVMRGLNLNKKSHGLIGYFCVPCMHHEKCVLIHVPFCILYRSILECTCYSDRTRRSVQWRR